MRTHSQSEYTTALVVCSGPLGEIPAGRPELAPIPGVPGFSGVVERRAEPN